MRAVENALQLEIPVNAQLIRNIIQTRTRSRTIVHFYHLSAVDWVDVVSALDAPRPGGHLGWPSRCRTGRSTARTR